MLPRRLNILRPYLMKVLERQPVRPRATEVARYVLQPSRKTRAARYIQACSQGSGQFRIRLAGHTDRVFRYPTEGSWADLCQSIDECFNRNCWHHWFLPELAIGPDDVVADCGAAEGLFTFVAASKARQVFAIEPVPFFVAALRANFAKTPNVEILPTAVGERNGKARMVINGFTSHLSPAGPVEVPVARLDDLLADNPIRLTLLKADVEGAELTTLIGARRTIRKYKPRVVMAVYHDQDNVAEIQDFLSRTRPEYRFRTRGIAENGNPVLLIAH